MNLNLMIATPAYGCMIFGGGSSKSTIDYITISSGGDAFDFGDLPHSVASSTATSNA
jgi:succinyl-CoA synthetase beta subunit